MSIDPIKYRGVPHMSFKRATLNEFRAELGRVKCPKESWSDCIQFAGTRGTNGYNLFRTVLPSTVAAYLCTGRIPCTVVHRCGNKNCVNFAHLSIHQFMESAGAKSPPYERTSKSAHAPTVTEVIAVLAARPESGKRYSMRDIVRACGIPNEKTVRQALRLAPVFDVAEDAEYYRGKLAMDKLLIPLNEALPTV